MAGADALKRLLNTPEAARTHLDGSAGRLAVAANGGRGGGGSGGEFF